MTAIPRRLAGTTLALALALVSCLGAQPVAAVVTACPTTALFLRGPTAYYPTASLDTSYTTYGGTYRASFDLVGGTIYVFRPIANFGMVEVTTGDLYDVEGLPAGTVVPVTVALDVNGHVESANICGGTGCGATFDAQIIQGTTVVEQTARVGYYGSSDLVTTLQLPLSITVGQPVELNFQLFVSVGPGGDGYGGYGTGRIHFDGLPAGAHVVSCHGYASQTVPALPTSWGRLKSIYR